MYLRRYTFSYVFTPPPTIKQVRNDLPPLAPALEIDIGEAEAHEHDC